jgi:hypothetical protein
LSQDGVVTAPASSATTSGDQRRGWPPKPATVVVLLIAALGVVGAGALVLNVLETPQVPDRVIPVPEGAEVVGDVALPVDGTGAEEDTTQRTVSIASEELDAEQLAEAVVEALEDVGWQLEPGPLGPGNLVSSTDLDGEYDLDLRVRTGVDGPPSGVRSPPWQPGQPYVSVSVASNGAE